MAALTGWGAVTAMGAGRDALRRGLIEGRSAISDIVRFDTSGLRARIGALVPGYERDDRDGDTLTLEYAVLAARGALEHAGVDPAQERVALVFGTSLSGDLRLADLTAELARRLGLRGPSMCISTACTSSAFALGLGAQWVQTGVADIVLAGGADALTPALQAGFDALGVLSTSPCTPFQGAAGTSLGEGAGMVVLERAGRPGITRRGTLAGFGLSGDAHHETSPDPRGAGVARALCSALADAGITPADVAYVNAHGTGTDANDSAEWLALKSALGSHSVVPVSSIKGHVGHAQGAAGVVEIIGTLECMGAGTLPGSASPSIERRRGAPSGLLDGPGAQACARSAARYTLCASSAFGGSNCAVVIRPGATSARRVEQGARTVYWHGAGAVLMGLTLDEALDGASLVPGLPELDWRSEVPTVNRKGLDPSAEMLIAATARANRATGYPVAASTCAGMFVASPAPSSRSAARFRQSIEARGLCGASATAFARVVLNASQASACKAFALKGPQTTLTSGDGEGLLAIALAAEHLRVRRDTDALAAGAVHEAADQGGAGVAWLSTRPSQVVISRVIIGGPSRAPEVVSRGVGAGLGVRDVAGVPHFDGLGLLPALPAVSSWLAAAAAARAVERGAPKAIATTWAVTSPSAVSAPGMPKTSGARHSFSGGASVALVFERNA